eukprot:6614135-Alexandrium_andersonii.AAC.1
MHVTWVTKLTTSRAMRCTLLRSWAWSCARAGGQALGQDAEGQAEGREKRETLGREAARDLGHGARSARSCDHGSVVQGQEEHDVLGREAVRDLGHEAGMKGPGTRRCRDLGHGADSARSCKVLGHGVREDPGDELHGQGLGQELRRLR